MSGIPKGIRTPVTAVKGRCPRPLDDGDVLSNQRRAFYEGYAFESTPFLRLDCIYINNFHKQSNVG